MKSIFRATAILSGSSLISLCVGIVSAKVLALILQPAGYGYYGLLQSFLGVTTLLSGLGMATGMVRLGARAAAQNEHAKLASLRTGAWLLFSCLGSVTLLVLYTFRVTLSRWALGSPDHGWTIVLIGVALLFTVAGNIQMGTLNAYHRVGALAKYGVVNTLGGALITIGAVVIWHSAGIVPAVIAGAFVNWAASRYFLHREVRRERVMQSRQETFRSAWDLLRFGGPFTASVLVGSGVQLALPMIVLHLLNPQSVGYYKAAAAISVGYLGFLVTAMGLDYYPRASAVSDQPKALVKLINDQHRLVMLIAVPIILGMLALVPIIVPLVYSTKFSPAVEILEWQLIGDLFKFSSWTIGFAILARCSTSVYFLTESIGGLTTLLTTWLFVRWFGLSGLGISFLATYVIYYVFASVIIRREIPLTWTASNKKMMIAGVASALIVRIMPYTQFSHFRTPVALALASIVGIPNLLVLWREFMTSSEPPLASQACKQPGTSAVQADLQSSSR
jgi:PST family polysaccharide transporter